MNYLRRALVGVCCCVSLGLAAARAAEPTNIVIILADDLGQGDLGCYGHPRFKTPRLDQMAAEGVRFTQFNTPAPFCAPTRASLLTGRYPMRCRMMNNPSPDGSPQSDAAHLPETEVLLPQLLKQAGYATCMVGKWHLGHQRPEWKPTRRGFDEYLGILYSNDMRPVELIDGEEVVEYPVVQATLTRRYTERALSFIERNREAPFFLYLAHAMPHKPLACSERFYKQSGAGLYGDVMAELDWSVGEVLNKLRDLSLDERTLVIFTSDNGPWYGGSAGKLRGMKGTAWEGGYRVPCIMRWPGQAPSGRTIDQLAVTMDVFATALAAAGTKAPDNVVIDGKDLLPVSRGETGAGREFAVAQNGGEMAVIRDQRWKLHVRPQPSAKRIAPGTSNVDRRAPDGVTLLAPYEQATRDQYPGLLTGDETTALSLFDLANDPGEQRNVAATHPDIVTRLKRQFDEAVESMR